MADSIIKIADRFEVSVDASCERLRDLSEQFARFIRQMNQAAGRAAINLRANAGEAQVYGPQPAQHQ
jgi:hypothetical protein